MNILSIQPEAAQSTAGERLRATSRRIAVAIRQPALILLALHALALWPHARWMFSRVLDGSDMPLGLAALATLGLLVLRHATNLREKPRGVWMLASVALLIAATAARMIVPPLPAAMLGVLSMTCALAAWLPPATARLPLAGLALLSLPLISSLQFYAGYPLRVLTAAASAGLLRTIGVAAERSGASMTIDAHLVIVDAPCSGVKLAWMAYFTACATAAWTGRRDRRFAARLPLVGALVLAGNILRNSFLVVCEARPIGLPDWQHEAIGLVVLALVCAAVAMLIRAPGS